MEEATAPFDDASRTRIAVRESQLGVLGALVDEVVAIEREIAKATARRTEVIARIGAWAAETAEASASREHSVHGWDAAMVAHRTASSELGAALRVPEGSAAHLIREAEVLTADLPGTMAALEEGAISYRHAQRIVEHADDLPPAERRELDAALHPAAGTLTVAQLDHRARRTRERLHPESMSARRDSRLAERRVGIEPAPDEMAWVTAYVPAVEAVAIGNRLHELARIGRTAGDSRTLAQLRADVFTDLLMNGEVPGTAQGIRAKVLVTVPALTLLERRKSAGVDAGAPLAPGELEGYGPISPETAQQIAAGAPSFIRLLTHPETGAVLSVGRTRYAVPADLRTWLQVRDQTCRFPGCRTAASHCDLDHTDEWSRGSPTDHDNLEHLCEPHHRLKHHTLWRIRQTAPGMFEWTSPTGREYIVRPYGAEFGSDTQAA